MTTVLWSLALVLTPSALIALWIAADMFLAGVQSVAKSALDVHIDEALAVANAPDLDGNVRFYDGQGVTR